MANDTNHIFQVWLRTSDAEAARAFYADVLGVDGLRIFPLHEQAVSRGARPHWLGFLQVADVAQAAEAFAQRGASSLAPKWVNPEGLEAEVMRDPGGAMVALAKPPAAARAENGNSVKRSGAEVVRHVLHTTDVARAKASYGELFGWEFKQPFELGDFGVVHPFAWERGGAAVGSLLDIAGRPEVHPHWLFFFPVPALNPALDAVRAGGGKVLGPVTLPSGERVAVCDDPQGAAFALQE